MDRWERLELDPQLQRPVLLEDETELLVVQRVGLYDR